jgi:hypothetical protein
VHVNQVWYGASEEGVSYVVDSFNINSDIPYADRFYVHMRFAYRATSPTTSELRASGIIRYHDPAPWGFIQSMIEGPAYSEIKVNYADMAQDLYTRFET